MKTKKRTAKAVASLSGQKYINKNLSFVKVTTPFQIGQDIFPCLTGVFLENQKKESQCHHCLKWFDWLPYGAVKTESVLRGMYVGICGGCINSLSILPPAMQDNFWRKVEKNLKNTLGVNTDG